MNKYFLDMSSQEALELKAKIKAINSDIKTSFKLMKNEAAIGTLSISFTQISNLPEKLTAMSQTKILINEYKANIINNFNNLNR